MISDTLTTIERLGGEMKSFDEWFGEASQDKLFWESPSKASKMGFKAGQQSKQAKIDELQERIDLFDKMILSLRNEFNLWADDTEPFDAIEAQLENLEELLK